MEFKKLTNEEIDRYITTVVKGSNGRVLISPLLVTYDKFIQPKTPCMANVAKAHAFVMDCTSDYKKFLQYYRDCNFGESLAQQIQVVDNFVNDYFGFKKNDEQRQSINGSNPDFHSIQKYKGQNCAMCFERAILSHNLFKLLGLRSILVTKNLHTYNLIKFKNSIYLYDPTNPTIGEIKGQTVRFPTVGIINNKDIQGYLFGKQSITISPSYYELMFGAKNVRTPKLEYVGLELQDLSLEDELDS